MPTIKVNTALLKSYESDMKGILRRVNSINDQFDSVSRKLDWDIKAESDIKPILSNISRELSAESDGIKGMREYLDTAQEKYDAAENQNSGKKLKNEDSFWDDGVGKWLIKSGEKILVLGPVIQAGNVIAIFVEGFTGENFVDGVENAVKVAKYIYGAAKDVVKMGTVEQVTGNPKNDTLLKFLGLDDSLPKATQAANVFLKKQAVTQSWVARFTDTFGATIKESLKKLKTPSGIVTSIITTVMNVISNYKEWEVGEISAGRAIAETITESILEIGNRLLVGAAVMAVLGATWGSAPVLAVATISVGISIGVDALTKWITKKITGEEKGFTEAVSDFVLDAAEKIGEGIESVSAFVNVRSNEAIIFCGG